MSQRAYPPLTIDQVVNILIALGFVEDRGRRHGDHKYYIKSVNGRMRVAQVDFGAVEYTKKILKLLIDESGYSKNEFYGATKSTAKKLNLKFAPEK